VQLHLLHAYEWDQCAYNVSLSVTDTSIIKTFDAEILRRKGVRTSRYDGRYTRFYMVMASYEIWPLPTIPHDSARVVLRGWTSGTLFHARDNGLRLLCSNIESRLIKQIITGNVVLNFFSFQIRIVAIRARARERDQATTRTFSNAIRYNIVLYAFRGNYANDRYCESLNSFNNIVWRYCV